jgi:zinc D-Ala-D-Ala carboxypeptidase
MQTHRLEGSHQPPVNLRDIHSSLGIPSSYALERGLPLYEEPDYSTLRIVTVDYEGKPFILTESAQNAWRDLESAAISEGVKIFPFSGFRSYVYQQKLIERALSAGRSLDDVLANIAAPGHSEHHTGRCADLFSPECEPLSQRFEETKAFRWLSINAPLFNFVMSFPRQNPWGFIYEPWHWCWQEGGTGIVRN